jgi:hypothetical protein
MGERGGAYRVFCEETRRKDTGWKTCVSGNIILKWIVNRMGKHGQD